MQYGIPHYMPNEVERHRVVAVAHPRTLIPVSLADIGTPDYPGNTRPTLLPHGRTHQRTLLDFETNPDSGSGAPSYNRFLTGTRGWQMVSVDGASVTATWNLPQAVNIAGRYIEWWVWISDTSAIGQYLHLYFSIDAQFTRYFGFTQSAAPYKPGWNHIVLPKSSATAYNGATADDWQNINMIHIRIQSAAGTMLETVWDRIAFFGRTPLCVISFDDGTATDYAVAYPLLAARGMQATHFVIPSRVGKTGYMTLAQLRELYDAGHDIASHAYSHVNLTTIDINRVRNEMRLAAEWLDRNGFHRSSRLFAYPYGAFNAAVTAEAARWYILARTASGGFDDIEYMNPYQVQAQAVTNTMTLQDFQALVDQAIADQLVLVLLFHDLRDPASAWSTTPTIFEGLLDYLASKRSEIRVVPFSYLASEF